MNPSYTGVLEIDDNHGILYFHDANTGQTVLRVSHLKLPIPAKSMIDITAVEHLTSYTVRAGLISERERGVEEGRQEAIRKLSQMTPEERAHVLSTARHPSAIDMSDIDESDEWDSDTDQQPCPVCRKYHERENKGVDIRNENFMAVIYRGHEYVIMTKTNQQTYPREWRMGFIGWAGNNRLQFSARGPNRNTHGSQYAGDVMLDTREINNVREVVRDDKERHVGRRNLIAEIAETKSKTRE